jgi:hypothetical protein
VSSRKAIVVRVDHIMWHLVTHLPYVVMIVREFDWIQHWSCSSTCTELP